MGTNVRAPLFLAQAAAPALRQTAGLIINIVDIHGLRPLKDHPVYSTAKAALVMLTRSLARELAPEVRVNGIAPGPVLWPEKTRSTAQPRRKSSPDASEAPGLRRRRRAHGFVLRQPKRRTSPARSSRSTAAAASAGSLAAHALERVRGLIEAPPQLADA